MKFRNSFVSNSSSSSYIVTIKDLKYNDFIKDVLNNCWGWTDKNILNNEIKTNLKKYSDDITDLIKNKSNPCFKFLVESRKDHIKKCNENLKKLSMTAEE